MATERQLSRTEGQRVFRTVRTDLGMTIFYTSGGAAFVPHNNFLDVRYLGSAALENLCLLARGKSYAEIAASRSVAQSTVSKTFNETIFHRLDAHNPAHAIVQALRMGFLDSETDLGRIGVDARPPRTPYREPLSRDYDTLPAEFVAKIAPMLVGKPEAK